LESTPGKSSAIFLGKPGSMDRLFSSNLYGVEETQLSIAQRPVTQIISHVEFYQTLQLLSTHAKHIDEYRSYVTLLAQEQYSTITDAARCPVSYAWTERTSSFCHKGISVCVCVCEVNGIKSLIKNTTSSSCRAWCHTPIISALRTYRQEHECEDSLGYVIDPVSKKQKQKNSSLTSLTSVYLPLHPAH
jgi:hypothetical protein